jgi:hypothetical protein
MVLIRVGLPLLLLLPANFVFADQALLQAEAEANVNQKYTIESVAFAGTEVAQLRDAALPQTLRGRLFSLIGQRCDVAALENLSDQIRKELHFRAVTEHLSKGSAPDRIKVNFEVVRHDLAFELSLPQFRYHSQQGLTGEIDASTQFKQNNLEVGLVSNGDDLAERFTGVVARFESAPLGSDRLHAGLTVEDYRSTWTNDTRSWAQGTSLDLYRGRWNIAPQVSFAATRDITVVAGASFEQTESENPQIGNRSANAATFSVKAGHKIEGNAVQQQIEGKYSLRVATRVLGSTYAYARHLITMRYEAKSGKHTGSIEMIGGSIAGNAPFFERFVLGSSSTLRGWDRYDIDPLGGSRVVHNELTYGYKVHEGTVQAFYDAGALWHTDAGVERTAAQFRHSLGLGFKQGIFTLTLAFPLSDGRVQPVFMAGMNY